MWLQKLFDFRAFTVKWLVAESNSKGVVTAIGSCNGLSQLREST